MACNECNQNITPCNEQLTPDCSCALKLNSVCIKYDGENLLVLDVVEGEDLTSILVKINDLINTALNEGLYTNIGAGVGVYKQKNLLGQAEFKTIIDTDSINITLEGAEEIKAEVDTVWLTTQIQTLIDATPSVTVSNIGTGAQVFKGLNGSDNELRSLTSDTLEIIQNTNDISINIVELDNIQRFIVNNLYTGTTELGTASKPFKNIQNALTAFVGTGSYNSPQYSGATIIIQRGNSYSFSGNFSYRNLNIVIEEGVTINHSPATGAWFVDYDSLTDTLANLTIEIKKGAIINLDEKGFRNKGSLGGSPQYKTITLTGTGRINLNGEKSAGYVLFDANSANSSGYDMPTRNNFYISDLTLFSHKKDIWKVGREADVTFENCNIRHSNTTDVIDASSEVFDQTGGLITLNSCSFFMSGTARTNCFTFSKNASYGCTATFNNCQLVFPQSITNMFVNKSSGENPTLNVQFFTTTNSAYPTNLFSSPTLWTNVFFRYNIFFSGAIDGAQVDLTNNNTLSVTNLIKNQNIDSLVAYDSRALAAVDLDEGAKFINTNGGNVDTATHFIDIIIA